MTTFTFQGTEYRYFGHPYNHADQNVRAVEVPLVRAAIARTLRRSPSARVLEVGNVLGHYGPVKWWVVDLAERGKNVINADILNWVWPEPFDLIVSISTIEHVGYGRWRQWTGSATPAAALAAYRSHLAPGGRILATAPTGYNPGLDEALRTGTLGADRLFFMRRVADPNEWAECSRDEALAMPYCDGRHRWGGGLVIIYCRNGGRR